MPEDIDSIFAEFDGDFAEDTPDAADEAQEGEDLRMAKLEAELRELKGKSKAKELRELADEASSKYLATVPEEHRDMAAVWLAGAKSPEDVKRLAHQVQSKIGVLGSDDKPVEDDKPADDEPVEDKGKAFAPLATGELVVPKPAEEQHKEELMAKVAKGDARAALALIYEDDAFLGKTASA